VKVIILEAAQNDLEEIAGFIGGHNPKRALSFVEELLGRCESLADMPLAFPLVPRYEHYGIRRLPYRDYLIFYRLKGDSLEVIHIVHGARNYESLLLGGVQ
jgi:toxin ParE1/3/4